MVKVILDMSNVVKGILEGSKRSIFLFYFLLINLDISYFLGRIHIYRRRERYVHRLREVVRLPPLTE